MWLFVNGLLAFLGKMAVLWAANKLIMGTAKKGKGNQPAEFSPPTADPNRPIPVVWGTCKVQPNVFWWGDTNTKEFTRDDQFQGYEYFSGVAMVVCMGAVDEVVDIYFDNTRSLDQAQQADIATVENDLGGDITWPIERPVGGLETELKIDAQTMFGGPAKEGGIRGKIDIYWGTEEQLRSEYIQDRVIEQALEPFQVPSPWLPPPDPGDNPNEDTIPAYKNICYLVFKRTDQDQLDGEDAPFKWGVTPQLKGVHLVVSRCPDSLAMSTTAVIEGTYGGYMSGGLLVGGIVIKNANAAHAIYEILTNVIWGLKISPDDIDLVSFQACAQMLFDELLGVSLQETEGESAYEIITEFLRHVDGVLYEHPQTGLITMMLIRGDYEIDDLLVVTKENSSDLKFQRPLYADIATGIKVKWTNPAQAFREDSLEWQNQATLDIAADESRQEISLPGFTDLWAVSIATGRLGKALTLPFARASFNANREVFDLVKGMPFLLNFADEGIGPIVMRVLEIDYGSLDDGTIQVQSMQDVFSGLDPITEVPLGTSPNVIVGDASLYESEQPESTGSISAVGWSLYG